MEGCQDEMEELEERWMLGGESRTTAKRLALNWNSRADWALGPTLEDWALTLKGLIVGFDVLFALVLFLGRSELLWRIGF